jgi:hypothetical protein
MDLGRTGTDAIDPGDGSRIGTATARLVDAEGIA